jgi:hypothetical protein
MAYKPRKDIKVPESYIQKIRATKTKSAALAKYGDSNDPKMREALRRFYGDVGAPKPMGDTARAKASTLPRKSVAMKTVAQAKPSRTGATPARGNTPYKPTKSTTASKKMASTAIPGRNLSKMTPSQRKRNDDLAKFGKNVLYPAATSVLPVTKGAMVAKAAYGAAAKQAGVKSIKQGVKKGIATKGELKEARSMARGMVKDSVKLKSNGLLVKIAFTIRCTIISAYRRIGEVKCV